MHALPVNLTPSLLQSWEANTDRRPGQTEPTQLLWADQVGSVRVYLRNFLNLRPNDEKVISILVTGEVTRRFLRVTDSVHTSFMPKFVTLAKPGNRATLMVPFSAFTHLSLKDVQERFYAILMDKAIIKVTYGLIAAADHVENWIPSEVVVQVKSLFDIGYLYHSYPAEDSVVPGGFEAYRDYHQLGDANSLDSIFERCFQIPSTVGIDLSVSDQSF